MNETTTTETKPGRLTDDKSWFCKIDQHDKCAVELELESRFEGCPCECHQKLSAPQPAPDAGEEWRVGGIPQGAATARYVTDATGAYGIAYVYGDTQEQAYQRATAIVSNHTRAALVPKLVAAIESEAARRAYAAGLGVSEWRAFLWPEASEALALVKGRQQ
jgi:hypothetical protein